MVVLIVGLIPTTAPGEDGTISDFEKPYRDRPETISKRSDGDTTDWGDVAGEAVLTFGRALAGARGSDDGHLYQHYPYQRTEAPFWVSNVSVKRRPEFQTVSTTARLEHFHVNDDLIGGGISGELTSRSGYSFRGSITEYREVFAKRSSDELLHADAHFSMDLTFGDRWMVTPGLGATLLDGESTSTSGPSYGTTLRWFPRKPLHVSGSIYHSLLSGEDLIDYRSRLHIQWKQFDLSIGYRSLRNAEDTDLSGPTLGLSVWF